MATAANVLTAETKSVPASDDRPVSRGMNGQHSLRLNTPTGHVGKNLGESR